MRDWIVCLILFLPTIYVLLRAIKPNIEIVQIDTHKYRVLLWYNSSKDGIVCRKWKKLFEYKTGKT